MLQRTQQTGVNAKWTQTQLMVMALAARQQTKPNGWQPAPRRLVPKNFRAEIIGRTPLVHHRTVRMATGPVEFERQPYAVYSPVIYAREIISARQMAMRILRGARANA